MKFHLRNFLKISAAISVLCIGANTLALAQELSPEEEAARKAQDPLADVKAIMTDNTFAFGTADDQTSYGFQVQPVYSVKTDHGFNAIFRGVVPIVGVPKGADIPKLGGKAPSSGTTWGVSDIMAQMFLTPQTDSDFKWGVGPQISLPTATSSRVKGPGLGVGLSGVAFGFAGSLSYGALVNHHWGEDSYSVSTIQPIVFYNLELFGGSYVGYNNSITYNWSASSGDRWQVPVGVTVGKTFALDGGYALDLNLGAYGLAERPSGGADGQFKFGISLFFP